MTFVENSLGVVAIIAILAVPFASLFMAFKGKIRNWVLLQCLFLTSAFWLAEIQNSERGSFVLITFSV